MSFSIPAPSSGVASLLSSQSHIPFGLLFNFQGAMKRSFTYSHWKRSNAPPKREKYLRIWKVLSPVPTGESKIIGCFWKNICFTKDPFTHLDKGGRNAHPFLRLSKKNFYSVKISPHLFGITKPNDTLFRRKMRKYFSVASALFCLFRKIPSFIPTGNSQMHTQNLKKFFVPSLIWNWEAETQPIFKKKILKTDKKICPPGVAGKGILLFFSLNIRENSFNST